MISRQASRKCQHKSQNLLYKRAGLSRAHADEANIRILRIMAIGGRLAPPSATIQGLWHLSLKRRVSPREGSGNETRQHDFSVVEPQAQGIEVPDLPYRQARLAGNCAGAVSARILLLGRHFLRAQCHDPRITPTPRHDARGTCPLQRSWLALHLHHYHHYCPSYYDPRSQRRRSAPSSMDSARHRVSRIGGLHKGRGPTPS
jgi:hypothetical protein